MRFNQIKECARCALVSIFCIALPMTQAVVDCRQTEKLFNAAYAGNEEILDAYHKAQCPLDVSNALGLTLYDVASLTGNGKLMKKLVTDGAAKSGHYSPALIKLVQTGMRYIDHDAGPIDGKLNSDTQTAIKSYQRSLGKRSTGTIDVSWLPYFHKSIIRQAQRDLTRFGYTSGGADGILGSKTQNAMRSFRASNELEVPNFGQIDYKIIYRLMIADNERQKIAIEKREADARVAAQKMAQQVEAKRKEERRRQKQAQAEKQRRAAEAQKVRELAVRREQEAHEKAMREQTSKQPIQLNAKPVVKIVQPDKNTQQTAALNADRQRKEEVRQAQILAARKAEEARKKALREKQEAEQRVALAEEKQRREAEEAKRLAEKAEQEAREKALHDQAELDRKLNRLVAEREAEQEAVQRRAQERIQARQNSGNITTARAQSTATGGKTNSKFNTVSGILLYSADGSSCSINGQKMNASSCQNYRDTGANKHCDAVMNGSGVVVSLRCK